MNTARAYRTRQAAERQEPYTPVNQSAARSGIRPKLGWFLTVIEDRAAERTPDFSARWGIVYNAELRDDFRSDDSISRLWQEAEDAGFLKRVWTKKGARIGFIWLRRLNNRPVATAETFDDVRKELVNAVNDRKGRARTVRMTPEDACTYRKIAGAPTAKLRVHLPQNCGGSEGPPLEDHARGLEENTLKTTTTRPGASSSFLNSSTQDQEPERNTSVESIAPVVSVPCPAEDPPSVPELPAELVAYRAVLLVIATRFARFFRQTTDQALRAIVDLFREFRTVAKEHRRRFEPEWIGDALENTEQAKAAGQIKKGDLRYFRGILANYAKQGGPIRDGPTCHEARALLGEVASYGFRFVLLPNGEVNTDPIRGDLGGGYNEVVPKSVREKVRLSKEPILELLRSQASRTPTTENARL